MNKQEKEIQTSGKTVRGKRRILKREIEVKAIEVVNSFPTKANTKNVQVETR